MRKIIFGLVAAAAIASPLAATAAAHADTLSPAPTCAPVKAVDAYTETLYKYVPAGKVSDGPTQWDNVKVAAGIQKTYTVKGKTVDYISDGKTSSLVHAAVEGVTCSVTLPEHFSGEGTYRVIVPYVEGVDTFIMGAHGYNGDVAITKDSVVTKADADQFWIGHKAQDGYAIANPGTAQWHIDFTYAHSTHATGDVKWDFGNGQVTGTVKFDADATNGGSLDYQASNGMWLHGVVAPGTYQQIDAHTAVFGGEITSGSDDYTVNHEGTDYFTVKIVDGGTPDGNGDVIAVLANQDGFGHWLTSPDPTPSLDYPMDADHAGIVTAGNLDIN